MSALIGIFGCQASTPAMDAMILSLNHRARDGWSTHVSGDMAIGLGYTRVLSEDPLYPTIYGEGDLRIVCDARLDNRSALAETLGAQTNISEGDLVLLAYRKWGRDFSRHLLGDFAIAVMDAGRRRLILARDHVGVKPLFYRFANGILAFASEIRALVDLGSVFTKISLTDIEEARIFDFVAGNPPNDHVIMSTSLGRVPPGHTLEMAPAAAPQIERYWQPAPGPKVAPHRYAAEFRRIFDLAVQARLRSAAPVACLLSGGLDSTAIACSAANMAHASSNAPLKTISAVFDLTPDLNERPFIEAALKMYPFDHHFVAFDNYPPFGDFQTISRHHWRLFNAPGIHMTSKLMRSARETGAGVLLDGHGGDEVVSHGFGRLNELAEARHWLKLWREAGGVCDLYGEARTRFMTTAIIKKSRSLPIRALRWALKRRRRATPLMPSLTKEGVLHRRQATNHHLLWETERHIEDLRSIRHVEAIETIELTAAQAGLEARFPFYDVRLIEFCLSLPSDAKLTMGWTRHVFRTAMEGVIPKIVQWRRTKFDFSPHVARGLYAHHRREIEDIIINDPHGLGRFVNIDYLERQFQRLSEYKAGDKLDIQSIWRALALNEWLNTINITVSENE